MSQPPARTPRMPVWLTELATLSGVGYLAFAYAVSRWLTKPTLRPIRVSPDAHGLSWEPLSCRTQDGFQLAGWVVEPDRPRGTVVLFHGARHTREQTLSRTAFLAKAGYRCVAFDHRAHGESDGRRTSFGYHESQDVRAVLDLADMRWPDQPRAALGISMGAAALCYAADRAHRFGPLVLESLYHDIVSAFHNRVNQGYYPASFRRLSRGVLWFTQRRLGLRVEQLSPADHVAQLAPAPVMILTGEDDAHATPEDARRLCERAGEPRESWLVPGAGHLDVHEVGGRLYEEKILSFLERHLFSERAGEACEWARHAA